MSVGELNLDGLEDLLQATGHCLVLGGPGSGKTTAALAKANLVIASDSWDDFRRVLFLSFARSTVARIGEAATSQVSKKLSKRIELTTYHSFIWRLIRSHGYLLKGTKLRLLPPHEAAAKMANACKGLEKSGFAEAKKVECQRLLDEEGLLNFDLFAEVGAELLERSDKLCRIISSRHPIVFLDEFQDTNASEYRFIKCLARYSTIIALADPEQRIYEFRGADPKRIPEFITDFAPSQFDLAQRNHRSNGTDILDFANDLLSGEATKYEYEDVKISKFPTRKGSAQHLWVKLDALNAIKRVAPKSDDWSVAVLVPTQKLMLAVSDYLSTEQANGKVKLPKMLHEVAVDAEGPSLAGITIGRLLECESVSEEAAVDSLIKDICEHMVGRRGGKAPRKEDVQLIEGVGRFLTERKVVGSKRKLLVDECQRVVHQTRSLAYTGDPFIDWVSTRDIISESAAPSIQCLANDALHLRFLRKGASLRSKLTELWRSNMSYVGSTVAVRNAFTNEHFVAKSQKLQGLHVMTIHKSKGKEFDEVVIYEGVRRDRIVRDPSDERNVAQSTLLLRVGVSRASQRVSILTPQWAPCPLF